MIHAGTLATAMILLAGPVGDDPAAVERARHAGTWAVTSMIRDGADAPADVLGSIRRTVVGDHVVWTRLGKNFAGTRFVVDPTASPPTIDLIPDGGKDRDKRILGIYNFDGDSLTICVADADRPRPTEFAAGAGSKQTLQRFRREPATPQPDRPRSPRP